MDVLRVQIGTDRGRLETIVECLLNDVPLKAAIAVPNVKYHAAIGGLPDFWIDLSDVIGHARAAPLKTVCDAVAGCERLG